MPSLGTAIGTGEKGGAGGAGCGSSLGDFEGCICIVFIIAVIPTKDGTMVGEA